MKRLIWIVAAAMVIVPGCTKESGLTPETEGFSITVGTPQTKTVFDGDTYGVEWEENDALGVVIDDGSVAELHKFTKSEGNTFVCADFVPSEGVSYTYYVLYPYDETFSVTDGSSNAVVKISSGTQSGPDAATHIKTPLYGMAEAEGSQSPEIVLSHAASVMKINVSNDTGADLTISSVGLSSTDENAVMSGTFSIDFATGGLEASETSNSASVSLADQVLADGSSSFFYVAVAPFAAKNLSVAVNGNAVAKPVKEKGFDFSAGKVYATSVAYDAVVLARTVEDEKVYAALQTVKFGEVNITASVDGTTYYLCPEDGTFRDGEAVSVTRSETAGNAWKIPAEDEYRMVYNATAGTVTVYSSANEFNQPYVAEFNYATGTAWVMSREILPGEYYVYLNTGDDQWRANYPIQLEASLADPQVFVGKRANGGTISVSSNGISVKLGRLKEHFEYYWNGEGEPDSENNPETDSEVDFTSRVAAFCPGREIDVDLTANDWMQMEVVVSNKRWKPAQTVKISEIIIDIRNSRIRFEAAE